ncbi:hypothetical protein BaRGS_00012502 [Batillaria attramentaria]|uniref:G-protein coupled receptors family 1 profile domain-containing protein n=1 Tax=Batillaria attramentaria TaxID=370345 RepID=A0ABD0L9Z9_9CAEN
MSTPTTAFHSIQTISMNMSGGNGTEEDIDDWNYEWNFPFSVILAAILSISAFLAVVGNSMVLTVVIRHRGMRTRTNLFLVNLAVADLLVGAAVVPFAITTLIEGKWIFGPVNGTFCSINGWLNCFCLVASIHTLMYISVHKHYSITRPLGSHFKLRQILGMMAAAWVWAAVSSTITVTGLSSVRYKQGTTQCGPEYPSGIKSYVFHGIIQITNVVIPIVILTYCYTRMFMEIRAHSKRLQANSTLEQDIILAQQKKVTITLFIVLAVFVVCVLPFNLYTTYATIKKDKHFSPYLNPVAYAFLYLNSACNPIIYAFRSPSFREGYKEILCQTPHYVISDGEYRRHLALYRLVPFIMLYLFHDFARLSSTNKLICPVRDVRFHVLWFKM